MSDFLAFLAAFDAPTVRAALAIHACERETLDAVQFALAAVES